MDEQLLALGLCVAMAVWGFYASWAFRHGRIRQSARWYFDRYQPDFVRNMPFAAFPVAIQFTAAAVVIAAGRTGADVAVNIGSLALFTGMIMMVVFIVRPPGFLKPAWLIEREQSRTGR